MSHEVETAAFTNNKSAWHGLGNVLPDKIYSVQEALEAAGMDWTVDTAPVYHKNEKNEYVEIEDRRAIVRTKKDGKQDVIDTVSHRYEPLQNSEAFALLEPFLHEKECFISSAVSLCGGRKVCMVAQIEDNTREVIKNDTVESYILVATSHNGSMSTITKYTNIRTVCANTLRSALMSVGEWRSVRHTKTQQQKLLDIQHSMDIYRRNFDSDVQIYQEMAKKEFDLEGMKSLLEDLFEKELISTAKSLDIPRDEMTLEQCRITKNCLHNYMFSPDLQLEGVVDTGWSAFNAITEAVKDRSSRRDTRYDSIWFGADSRLLDRAKEAVLSF